MAFVAMDMLLLLLLLLGAAAVQVPGLVRIDLSRDTWTLTNANRSINIHTTVPAHVLAALAKAGVIREDPLYRYGELETRWVAEDPSWNFTLIWPGHRHAALASSRHTLLVLHGVDTFGHVVLNNKHLKATNNAHRSWYIVLQNGILQDAANMLSVVLQPPVAAALYAKATYPYSVPTMAVPGGFNVYNFARKTASDFGWDWGPAFAPSGITAAVELLGFTRAALIGALVHQQLVKVNAAGESAGNRDGSRDSTAGCTTSSSIGSSSSSSTGSHFVLTISAHFLVPEGGDRGTLTVTLPTLNISHSQHKLDLKPGIVAGNALQALVTTKLKVPAELVKLWQPRGRLAPGEGPALYDVDVMYTPATQKAVILAAADAERNDVSKGNSNWRSTEAREGSSGSSSSSIKRRIGFRTIELVREPIKQAAQELVPQCGQQCDSTPSHQSSQATRSSGMAQQRSNNSRGTVKCNSSHTCGSNAAQEAKIPAVGSWAQIGTVWSYIKNLTNTGVAWWWPNQAPGRLWPRPIAEQAHAVQAAVLLACKQAANICSHPSSGCKSLTDDIDGGNEISSDKPSSSSTKEEPREGQPRQQHKGITPGVGPAAAAAAVCASVTTAAAAATRCCDLAAQRETGESFYFRVNGVPIYAKGANLIPLHILSTAVTAEDVAELLESAAAANMNMIRVWGGGLYQLDGLYDAADKLGVLVWQEAMFACSPYPRGPGFLSNVQAEITEQILRLGSHPSIAVWGGNNEIEASMEWYAETKSNLALFAVDYESLFVETIGRLVNQMLPGAPWVDSSPSNGHIMVDDASQHSRAQSTALPSPYSRPPAQDTGQHQAGQLEDPHNGAAIAAAEQTVAATQQTVAVAEEAVPAEEQAKNSLGHPAADSLAAGSVPAGAMAIAASVGGGRVSADSAPVKRWGNSQNPKYGDVHFYNYKDDCQDWRTYPAARFISEYGWQSYPSWATYSVATAAEDWFLTANMTEFRQRHPNGTLEMLAQLQRRFNLPTSWQQLLHASQHNCSASSKAHAANSTQSMSQPNGRSSNSRNSNCVHSLAFWCKVAPYLEFSLQHMQRIVNSVIPLQTVYRKAHWFAESHSNMSDGDSAVAASTSASLDNVAARTQVSTNASSSPNNDMQHYVYLTQLQQLLCYETAISYWRRLRANSTVLTMGVLYWQLNDVWAGASWSSVDYGRVWKPLHYSVKRLFADVSLSIQQHVDRDSLQVYIVSDVLQPVNACVTIRMLSLHATLGSCAVSSSSNHTTSRQQQAQSQPQSATCGAASTQASSANSTEPWVLHKQVIPVNVPAASAVKAWSGSSKNLLAAAPDCSSSSCYVHVLLDAGGFKQQEVTVWLAPFSSLQLQNPTIQLTGFRYMPPEANGSFKGNVSAGAATAGTTGSAMHPSGSSKAVAAAAATSAAELAAIGGRSRSQVRDGAVAMTVSTDRVAAYTVWELLPHEQPQQQRRRHKTAVSVLQGYFSDNAVTLHPCEPRRIQYVLRHGVLGACEQHQHQAGIRSRYDTSIQLSKQQGDQQQQQQQEDVQHLDTPAAASHSSKGVDRRNVLETGLQHGIAETDVDSASGGQQHASKSAGDYLAALLRQQLSVSSLYDHQQFH